MDVEIGELDWDAWNEDHVAEHGVTRADVDDLCRGRRHLDIARGGRLRVVGGTNSGRIIVAILEPLDDGRHYCVTAFPATGRTRRDLLQREERNEL